MHLEVVDRQTALSLATSGRCSQCVVCVSTIHNGVVDCIVARKLERTYKSMLDKRLRWTRIGHGGVFYLKCEGMCRSDSNGKIISRHFVRRTTPRPWPRKMSQRFLGGTRRRLDQNETSIGFPSNVRVRVSCNSLTSMFLGFGGSMREPSAKLRVSARRTSFHTMWIPTHSPAR